MLFNYEKFWSELRKDNLEFITRDETDDPLSLRKVCVAFLVLSPSSSSY